MFEGILVIYYYKVKVLNEFNGQEINYYKLKVRKSNYQN